MEFRDPKNIERTTLKRDVELKFFDGKQMINANSKMESWELQSAIDFKKGYTNLVKTAIVKKGLAISNYIFDILTNNIVKPSDIQFLGFSDAHNQMILLNYHLGDFFFPYTIRNYFIPHEIEHLKSDPLVDTNLPRTLRAQNSKMRYLVYEMINDCNNVLNNGRTYLNGLRNANNGYFEWDWGPYSSPVVLNMEQMLKVVYQHNILSRYHILDPKFDLLYSDISQFLTEKHQSDPANFPDFSQTEQKIVQFISSYLKPTQNIYSNQHSALINSLGFLSEYEPFFSQNDLCYFSYSWNSNQISGTTIQ